MVDAKHVVDYVAPDGGWVITHFQFEGVCEPKFMSFWYDVGDPVYNVNAVARLSISCFVPEIQAVKVAAKLRNRSKKSFLGPRFVGERIPQILDMYFQITLASDHVAGHG